MQTNGCIPVSSEQNGIMEQDDSKRPKIKGRKGLAIKNDSSSESISGVSKVSNQSDEEIVRLIGQYLNGVGMTRTAEVLVQESGCLLENESVVKFRSHVLKGEWKKAEIVLDHLKPLVYDEQSLTKMKFLLIEQKYLEFLEEGKLKKAIDCLQRELSVFSMDSQRLYQLSSLVCANKGDLYDEAAWRGKGASSRQQLLDKLQLYLPPSVMLPPHRLKTLLEQAMEQQKERCTFHNTRTEVCLRTTSLLTDHSCNRADFPCTVQQVLTEHPDEVWFCRFSPDGSLLATGAKDGNLILWRVIPDECRVRYIRTLECQQYGVAFIAWSPDSKYLITCGQDDSAELFIWDVDRFELKAKVSHSPEDSLTTAAWHSDSTKFICGGLRGQFYYCDLSGNVLETWEGVRIQCVACLNDNRTALAADTHYRIRAYNFFDMSEQHTLKEDNAVMSFTLDETCRFALLNVQTQGVNLWDLQDKCLVRRFQGLAQTNFAVYSCFGGLNQDFIASGSEDHKIYIWHRRHEHPIAVFEAHCRPVSCVHWNPVHHNMLASVSDDGTVRIWGPAHLAPASSSSSTATKDATTVSAVSKTRGETSTACPSFSTL